MEQISLNCSELETEFKDLYSKIRIYGTVENPYFVANDVADALGIDLHYRGSNTPFTDKHKTKITILNEQKKKQEVIAFTESGLTFALFRSRAPVALRYQELVYQVMKSLRLKGMTTLKESLAEMKKVCEATAQRCEATSTEYYNRMKDAVTKAEDMEISRDDYKDKYLNLKIKYDECSVLGRVAKKQYPCVYIQAYEDGKTVSIDSLDTSIDFKFKAKPGDYCYELTVLSVRKDITTLEDHLSKNGRGPNSKGYYTATILELKKLVKILIFTPIID